MRKQTMKLDEITGDIAESLMMLDIPIDPAVMQRKKQRLPSTPAGWWGGEKEVVSVQRSAFS